MSQPTEAPAQRPVDRNLRETLATLTRQSITELIRNTSLGSLDFSEAKSEFELVQKLSGEFLALPVETVPDFEIDKQVKAFDKLRATYESILRLSMEDERFKDRRNELVADVRRGAQDAFRTAFPLMAYLRASGTDFVAHLEALGSAASTARSRLADMDQLVVAAREAGQRQGVAIYEAEFGSQATEHERAAARWLISCVALVALLMATSIGLAAYYAFGSGATATSGGTASTIQLAIAKAIFFSTLATALVASTRSYRAHRHNYVVNKHRQNALRTFKVFVESAAADPETKSRVLIEATSCIFGPQPTGYSSSEADSPQPQIIELVRHVAQPRT